MDETHCSVFVRPVIGRFDVVLHGPPINQKLTLTLMNQISNTEHYSGIICFCDAVDDRHVTHRVLFTDTAGISITWHLFHMKSSPRSLLLASM